VQEISDPHIRGSWWLLWLCCVTCKLSDWLERLLAPRKPNRGGGLSAQSQAAKAEECTGMTLSV